MISQGSFSVAPPATCSHLPSFSRALRLGLWTFQEPSGLWTCRKTLLSSVDEDSPETKEDVG